MKASLRFSPLDRTLPYTLKSPEDSNRRGKSPLPVRKRDPIVQANVDSSYREKQRCISRRKRFDSLRVRALEELRYVVSPGKVNLDKVKCLQVDMETSFSRDLGEKPSRPSSVPPKYKYVASKYLKESPRQGKLRRDAMVSRKRRQNLELTGPQSAPPMKWKISRPRPRVLESPGSRLVDVLEKQDKGLSSKRNSRKSHDRLSVNNSRRVSGNSVREVRKRREPPPEATITAETKVKPRRSVGNAKQLSMKGKGRNTDHSSVVTSDDQSVMGGTETGGSANDRPSKKTDNMDDEIKALLGDDSFDDPESPFRRPPRRNVSDPNENVERKLALLREKKKNES